MIRRIVDYQKLNEELLNLLVEKFPDGYGDNDIIAFRNAKNEIIEAVEIRTKDKIYLVKVGKRLTQAMKAHNEESSYRIDEDTSFEEDSLDEENFD